MGDWYDKTGIGDLVDRAARRYGPSEALYYQGGRWTFNQIKEDVDRCGRALMALGIEPGEKVVLWMPNRPEWVHLFFAVMKIGAVLVPANTRLREMDLEYVVRQSDAATLITVDRSGPVDYLDMVKSLCPEVDHGNPNDLRPERFPELKRVVVHGERRHPGALVLDEVLKGAESVPTGDLEARQLGVDPDGAALIMYTSGTTGFPKGVVHSHKIQRTINDAANRLGMTRKDVVLMYLPLFHAFGLYKGPLMSSMTGARVVLTTLFDPEESLQLIEQERATVLHGFDTHFRELALHPNCENTDRSSLRTGILAAGMASSEATARLAQKMLCHTVSGWGMTEVGVGASLSFLDTSEDDRCTGSGFPLPDYEFKVIDPDTGADLPPDSPGELCVRTYALMLGYYKKPDETSRAVDANGWFHTGDLGTIRDDGQVRFIGRIKELLKVGGENVDPVEVEALMLGHPAVREVQIVGVPDERLSEVACACVILKEEQEATADELNDYCRGKLASFKTPRHVLFVREYPMTPSGKVQKFKLRELAEEALGLRVA